MKKCAHCGKSFPATTKHFPANKRISEPVPRRYLRSYCRKCDAIRRRDNHLRAEYGINLRNLRDLLRDCANTCPICRTGIADLGRSGEAAHVDHCHETGKLRGVLCSKCNRALGLMGDSVDNLKRAVQYLKRHNGKHPKKN